MRDEDAKVAQMLHEAIGEFMDATDRSQQKTIGISELGTCRELTRRKVLELPQTNPRVVYSAFIGSAIGDWLEQAVVKKWPDAKRQLTCSVTLPSGKFELSGHPDIAWFAGGPYGRASVLDGKSADGLRLVEREGASDQQRYQRALYGLGLHQAGVYGDTPVEELTLANCWIDRSGREDRVHVESEPFTWDLAHDAEEFVNDVVYAIENGELASRDKPRNWCAKCCPFFDDCRGSDTDATDLIDHPGSVSAIEMYVEAKALEKKAAAMKAEAAAKLEGLNGRTPTHTLRWVHINKQDRPAHTVQAHDRIDIRQLRGK